MNAYLRHEVGGERAVAGEAGIERAGGGVARHGEVVIAATVHRIPRDDDFAVGLQGDA